MNTHWLGAYQLPMSRKHGLLALTSRYARDIGVISRSRPSQMVHDVTT